MKLISTDIEVAVARFFNPRVNIIAPNVWWGLGLDHEADLIIVSPKTGYAAEVEIKVSASDIKAEQKKRLGGLHFSQKIRRFYFAVPDYLKDCGHLRKDCGLLIIDKNLQVNTVRPPRINKTARPLSPAEINKLLHLGCMRIWSLKDVINSKRKEAKT